MTQQPAEERVETEDRGWSPWNVGSLAAAVALFLLGVAGLTAVFPYSEPGGFNALFVTSPSVTPAANPATAVKSTTGDAAAPGPIAEHAVSDPTTADFVAAAATEEPTEEAPPAVFAASQDQAPVATVADLPDPTATPSPEPTATPTEEPTQVPTAVPTEEPTVQPEPTPTVAADKPVAGEHPRSDPKKPVTAFIDDTNTGAQSNDRGGVSSPAQAVPPPPTN